MRIRYFALVSLFTVVAVISFHGRSTQGNDAKVCGPVSPDVTESSGGFYNGNDGQYWSGNFDVTFDCEAGGLESNCAVCWYYSIEESDATTDQIGSDSGTTGYGNCGGDGDEALGISFSSQTPLYSYTIFWWLVPKSPMADCPDFDDIESTDPTVIYDL